MMTACRTEALGTTRIVQRISRWSQDFAGAPYSPLYPTVYSISFDEPPY